LAAAKRSLRVRFIDASSTLVLSLSGAALGEAEGAAWGYAIAGCLRIPNAWWQFAKALREYECADDDLVADIPSEHSEPEPNRGG
jgi:hypothetical protein